MIDAQRLRVFKAVVAAGSVNGAAASLGYTPSAVSQQVAALQRETGLTLIERHGRGIVPTPAGHRLAHEAGTVLEGLAELDLVVGDLREGRVGVLTIGYISSAGTAWVPAVVAALSTEFPDLRLDLRLVELAQNEPYDPDLEVVVEAAGIRSGEGWETELLLDEAYVAVVHQRHRIAGLAEVALSELSGEVWVDNDVSRGPCRQIVLDACAAVGFAPAFRVQASDYPSAIGFVAAGVGLTVLPRLGTVGPTGGLPAELRAVPIAEPAPRRRVLLRVRPAVRDQPAVLRAIVLLHEAADRTAK